MIGADAQVGHISPNDEALARRAREIRAQVAAAAGRSGRPADAVLIIAVSKTMPAERVRDAYDLGFTTFGENRVQEAREKITALTLPGLRWELIGHLQTNKAALAVELFDRVQSVDSVKLAESLERHAEAKQKMLPVLLEVNVAGEETKSGFAPDEVLDAARALAVLPHLRPEGLMTVAPLVEATEAVRPVFRQLRELRDRLREEMPLGADGGWPHLSMGMTDDYAVAIEEGATIVRIGRALFGVRPAL